MLSPHRKGTPRIGTCVIYFPEKVLRRCSVDVDIPLSLYFSLDLGLFVLLWLVVKVGMFQCLKKPKKVLLIMMVVI